MSGTPKQGRADSTAYDGSPAAPRDSDVHDLFENSPDLIQIASPEGRILHVNAAWRKTLGYSSEAASQLTLRDVVHPDFHPRLDEDLARLMAGVESGPFEAEFVARDGRRVLLEGEFGVRTQHGRPVSVRGIFREVSRRNEGDELRREQQELLEGVLEGSGLAFWEWDLASGQVRRSPRWAAMLGYDPGEIAPTIDAWRDLLHPDEREQALRLDEEFAAGRAPAMLSEYRLRAKDGSYRWIQDRAGVVRRDASGRPARVSGTCADVTGQKQLELERGESSRRLEELVEKRTTRRGGAVDEMAESRLAALNMMQDAVDTRRRLEAANAELLREAAERQRAESEKAQIEEQLRQGQKIEAIGRLAGGVAHDFNNILGVISGFTELARESLAKDHPARSSLDEVLAAADRAASLTRQLLAFSRKQVVRPEALDLNLLLGELERMLRSLVGETIELRLRQSEDLGAVVADPSQIQQVILNLAINARDAMPTGGVLTIETANTEFETGYAQTHPPVVPGRFVRIVVSDTGSGMDEPTRARCFEPFFTTKPEGQGTGLGLSTVYGIVKQSGGYVWVYSELGRGTTFKIYLPRVDALAIPFATAAPMRLPANGTETVLLVEDTEGLRRMIRRILEGVGHTVLDAADGEAALEVADAHSGRIDLLLTDVVMPKLGGAELASRLARTRPGLRVLFMSGYTEGALSHQGVLAKGVALLEKPFTRETLVRAVRDCLDRPAEH